MNAVLKLRDIRQTAKPHPVRTCAMADALLSRTQQRVLGLLFTQPDQSLCASELIQRAGCGSGTVQRELARLQHCGLITQQPQGQQKRYQANVRAPAFAPLRALLQVLNSPWLELHGALMTLPGHIELAVIGPHDDPTRVPLLLVASDLKLKQVYPALSPVEAATACRITPRLYRPEEWRSLSAAKQARLCPPAAIRLIDIRQASDTALLP